MFGLSPPELMIVAVVAILLFGSKLPDVARSLGGSYREFRRGLNDMQKEFREVEREVHRAIETPISKKVVDEDDPNDSPEPLAPKFTPPSVSDSDSQRV